MLYASHVFHFLDLPERTLPAGTRSLCSLCFSPANEVAASALLSTTSMPPSTGPLLPSASPASNGHDRLAPRFKRLDQLFFARVDLADGNPVASPAELSAGSSSPAVASDDSDLTFEELTAYSVGTSASAARHSWV